MGKEIDLSAYQLLILYESFIQVQNSWEKHIGKRRRNRTKMITRINEQKILVF